MPEFSLRDREFMQRALQLAANGRFGAHPNPMVGCVLVKDDTIVGEGWHQRAGEAHAEPNALEAAGDNTQGATAFVTLEPCSHQGKTAPCCDALIAAGISEVVIAREDPNPKVNGQGVAQLEAAGVTVRSGLMRREADVLTAGFLSRVQRGRPRVRLKIACSMDGRIAMASGESQWITGPDARAEVQELRASVGAILTGVGTVIADDPSLTVRDKNLNPYDRQPHRVVLDSQLRMAPTARMLSLPGETLIYCCDDSNSQSIDYSGATIVKQAGEDGRVDIAQVLEDLAQREVNDVLVEAGPMIAGRILEQHLVDEIIIYQAPRILGSETLGMVATPSWKNLTDGLQLTIIDVVQIGSDMRITAIPVQDS